MFGTSLKLEIKKKKLTVNRVLVIDNWPKVKLSVN